MSERVAVLLRGVNVGGVTLRSADLRACLSDAGFADVRTVLASGNALVTTDGDVTAVADRVQRALLDRYEREIRVITRTQADLGAITADCPYASDSSSHHAYVVFFADDAAARDGFTALSGALTEARATNDSLDESLALGDGVVYWWCPRGSTLSTPVSKASEKTAKATLTTTRNLRTVLKLISG